MRMLTTTEGNDREVVVTSIAICWLLPKVIRILFQLVGLPGDYGPIRKIEAVFLKNVDFSHIKPIFWEFVLLKVDNARVHARGFASL